MSTIPARLRESVEIRWRYQCAYCRSQSRIAGGSFTIDHIVPESLGGSTVIENLCLACWDCNLNKGTRLSGVDPQTGDRVRLFHPNRQGWDDHFQWSQDSLFVIGRTAIGRATVIALRLNRPQLVLARTLWVEAGWHPPSE